MSTSTNFVSVPAGLLNKRQRRALLIEQPAPSTTPAPEYLDGKQLQAALNISDRTLDKWKQERVIPFIKVGGIIRFDLAAVKRALEQHIVPSK